jgi:outer membrane protein OmpA-like peptidoglycan-associated protein
MSGRSFALVLLLATAGAAGAASAACAPLVDADAALSNGDVAALFAAHEGAEAAGCVTDEQAQIARWLALGLRGKAYKESDNFAEAEPLLEEALSFAGPWPLQASLGDAARSRGAFDEAAEHYQLALQDALVLASPVSPYLDQPPSETIFADLRAKANETRLAASTFVTVPGRPACQIQAMGMWATEIVTPIRFVVDEVTFTRDGEQAADELFACLNALDPADVASITIIGHTDETGTDAYNQALSERRAARVKEYLEERGLRLPLATEGRGERELFVPDSAVAYTDDQRLQMSRRVEVDIVKVGS